MSKLLGIYEMGYERVEVRYDTGTASSKGELLRDGATCTVITVGIKQARWFHVLSSLLHEVIEVSLHRHRARFQVSGDISGDTGNCLFVFDHQIFANACVVSAELISACQRDLHKAWRASRKKAKGKK